MMKSFKLENQKTLLVIPAKDEQVYLSARNLGNHNVQIANYLNTYDILDCDKLIFVGNSHEIVEQTLKG